MAAASVTAEICGAATCSACGASQAAADVYGGAFDFEAEDAFIDRMSADIQNVDFDAQKQRYLYRGKVVWLASDSDRPEAPKHWWQFWR